MDKPKSVSSSLALPRGVAIRPIGLVRAVAGLVLFVLAGSAGLFGCAPPASSSSRPELAVPSVIYVSRDAQEPPEFHVEEKRAGHYTVTFDASDLKGIAVLRTAMDSCPVHLPVFTCGGQQVDPTHGGSRQYFRLSPADGAKAGASALLRYRLTSPGLATVTGRTRVIAGKPVLKVDARADRHDVDPDGRLAVSLTLRNTGDVPARGVGLFMSTLDGLQPAGKHGNCRYRGSTSVWCRLPAADVVIPPGASYHLAAPEVLRAAGDAMYPSVVFEAAAIGTDYVPPEEIASQYKPGQGADLRLVPGDDRGGTKANSEDDSGNNSKDDSKKDSKKDSQNNSGDKNKGGAGGAGAAHATGEGEARLHLSVRSTSDLVAIADTARGPAGGRASVRVGVRNDGPGALPAPVRVEFAVPAGTTVVSSPYDPMQDEEVEDQKCRALAADGAPLASASVRQPSARRYVCTAQAGAVGATTTFPFTFRIDREMAHRGGRVTVADGDSHHPSNDPTTADDTADVVVSVWPGPAWSTPGLDMAAAVVLGVAVLVLAFVVWRRRRTRRAGRAWDADHPRGPGLSGTAGSARSVRGPDGR